jgi:Na+-driven multidrug efflux pump
MWTIGIICDIFNSMFQAILNGFKKQINVITWNFIVCFFWLIPISYFLCFIQNFDVFGIWIGCVSCVFILALINFLSFLFLYKQVAKGEYETSEANFQLQKKEPNYDYMHLDEEEHEENNF